MSMDNANHEVALDAETIRTLIKEMQPEALMIFRDIIVDVRGRGGALSVANIDELAKKYADKSRKLAGSGGDE